MQKQTIIIIGGGASGLFAANKLAGKCQVILLEAKERLGGRICSKTIPYSLQVIETGAEFIHGHQKLTLKLLKKAGIKYKPVEGSMYYKENGKLQKQTEMIKDWDALMHKMKKVKKDISLYDFLQKYFASDKYTALRRQAINYAQGFDLADIKVASVRALYKEWQNEEQDNFRLPQGYGALIDFLKEACIHKGCTILTGKKVKHVEWQKNAVTVHTINNETFTGNKLIVTTPVHLLATSSGTCSIKFTPSLEEYTRAAANIGMGEVIKVIIVFKKLFWPAAMGFVFSNEIFPTWWTQSTSEYMLTGWVGGTSAVQLKHQNDETILQKAIASLSAIFNLTEDDIKNNITQAIVCNWQNEAHGLHGYSYSTLYSEEARVVLNTPVDNTIFFAGEGLYEGNSPGTVEAALVTGKQVAKKIRKTLFNR